MRGNIVTPTLSIFEGENQLPNGSSNFGNSILGTKRSSRKRLCVCDTTLSLQSTMGKKKQRSGVGTKPSIATKSGSSGSGSTAKVGNKNGIGSFLGLLFGVPFCTIKLAVWSLVGIPAWAFVLVLLPICGGWPPTLQTLSQSWRFLAHYTWGNSSLPSNRKVF